MSGTDPSYELFEDAVSDIETQWRFICNESYKQDHDPQLLQKHVDVLYDAYRQLIRYHRLVGNPLDSALINRWSYLVHHLRFRHYLQCLHCGYWWTMTSSSLDIVGTRQCIECHTQENKIAKVNILLPVGAYHE